MRLIDADRIPFNKVMQNPFNEQSEMVEVIEKRRIEQMPTIQAIPLAKVKKAREEMNDLDYLINDAKYSDRETRVCNVDILVNEFYEIMDNLIAESEEK
jgi:hypothetical protein